MGQPPWDLHGDKQLMDPHARVWVRKVSRKEGKGYHILSKITVNLKKKSFPK